MDFSKESYDATYTKVFEGVYVISERHRPHHKDSMPELNNRGFLFEVSDGKTKHLLMSGIPGSKLVANVQALEKDTGLDLTEIVTSGDFHHMATRGWLDAFPDANIYHSGLKFPTSRNGKEILAEDKYKARIELCEGFDFPPLEKYSDTVKFFGFNQFFVYPDMPFMTANEDKGKDGRKQNILSYMSKVPPCDQKMLAIWFFHVPSKQLIIEHNFDVFMNKYQIKKASLPLQMMMKKENFASCAKAPMPTGPKDKEGCKTHCEQMAQILQLDVAAINDYHSYPGVQIRKYTSKEEFVSDFTGVLDKTGESDPTGEKMFKLQNKSSSCIIL